MAECGRSQSGCRVTACVRLRITNRPAGFSSTATFNVAPGSVAQFRDDTKIYQVDTVSLEPSAAPIHQLY